MSQYVVTDTELTAVANAIRSKGGTEADLEWPSAFVSAIGAITGGGGNSEFTPSYIVLSVSVTGGYNGGAVITVSEDGTTLFTTTAISGSPYNLGYNDEEETITTSLGEVDVSITPPANSYSNLTIKLEGPKNVETLTISPNGANTSYGYNYSGTAALYFDSQSGGSVKNILGGLSDPSSSEGSNGDIYIKYIDANSLPSGYTPVQYIESLADQNKYIDTGLYPTDINRVDITFAQPATSETSAAFIGSCANYSDGSQGFGIEFNGSKTFGRIGNQVPAVSNLDTDVHEHILQNDNGSIKYLIDGVLQGTNTVGTTNSTYTIWLFRMHHNYGNSYARPSKMRLYRCKFYDTSDKLIKDYIPAVRTSDGATGLYDLVNDVFVGNSGSGGAFTTSPAGITNVYLKVNGAWVDIFGQSWDDVNTEGDSGSQTRIQGFELYSADFGGYTRNEKGIYDNSYFTCFFHDNLAASYTLNDSSYSFSTVETGYWAAMIKGDCKEIVSNSDSTKINAIISKKGSSFTVVHDDAGSYISVIGGWVGYPKSGTIYQNGTNGQTNTISLNSAHDKLLIFVGGSGTSLNNCSAIDINGTTYQVTNIGTQYDSMYGIYAAIEINSNSDSTITITFPSSCYSYVSIVGID